MPGDAVLNAEFEQQNVSAVFMARVESWIVTTRRKNNCAAGGYGLRARWLGMARVSSVCVHATAGSSGVTAYGL